jgi:effector-binding domain-containing protein
MSKQRKVADTAASKRPKNGVESSFEQTYPTITKWVKSHGSIEIGQLDWYRPAMARALLEDDLIWEGKQKYATLDDLLRDLESALSKWLKENP